MSNCWALNETKLSQPEIPVFFSWNGMNVKFHQLYKFSMFVLLVLIYHSTLNAKSLLPFNSLSYTDRSHDHLGDLEKRIRLYLEDKISGTITRSLKRSHQHTDHPDDLDMFLLARNWNYVSPSLKELYTQAAQIPDSFDVFVSSGGHFEIYYTTNKGDHQVNPNDLYMFNPQDWREKINKPNGIPDFVDEIAWALDSTWCMEIDRFNFKAPYVYKTDNYNSDRYKVVVANTVDSGEYGFTMIQKRAAKNGFSSFITIRNNWSIFNSKPFKYDLDPTPAIHVTCAHEFFHAIQFSMSWEFLDKAQENIQLDSFPLNWIESSAIAMEEFCFPDVNDYVHYASLYFSYPDISFFSTYSNVYLPYANALFLVYNGSVVSREQPAEFIRQLHLHNVESPIQFSSNIMQSSIETGLPWSKRLNSFHTASYYSGDRADSAIFIDDASLFTVWEYQKQTPQIQTVHKNSMNVFSYTRTGDHTDTLHVLLGQLASFEEKSMLENSWAASAIIRNQDSTTIFPISLNKAGFGTYTITSWDKTNEILVVVTNGFSSGSRKYDVDFISCPIVYPKGIKDTVYFNHGVLSKSFIALNALDDLRCALNVSTTNDTAIYNNTVQNNLMPVDSLFTVSYPVVSWQNRATLSYVINHTSDDTIFYSKWNTEQKNWRTLSVLTADSINSTAEISEPGTYGLLKRVKSPVQKFNNKAHPDYIRVYAGASQVIYEGRGIAGIAVFSVDGSLIYQVTHNNGSVKTGEKHQTYRWNLRNSKGSRIAPGAYFIVIQHYIHHRINTVQKKLVYAQ